jgi:hypothetical protein
LRLGPVEVKAVGLLTLEPSFALVVVIRISPPAKAKSLRNDGICAVRKVTRRSVM